MLYSLFFANADTVFKEIIPGHDLVTAKKLTGDWLPGMYGLVQDNGNEAIAIFEAPIVDDPFFRMAEPEDWTDEQTRQYSAHLAYLIRNKERFAGVDVPLAYTFVNALIQEGYKPADDGHPVTWFFNYVAEQVQQP